MPVALGSIWRSYSWQHHSRLSRIHWGKQCFPETLTLSEPGPHLRYTKYSPMLHMISAIFPYKLPQWVVTFNPQSKGRKLDSVSWVEKNQTCYEHALSCNTLRLFLHFGQKSKMTLLEVINKGLKWQKICAWTHWLVVDSLTAAWFRHIKDIQWCVILLCLFFGRYSFIFDCMYRDVEFIHMSTNGPEDQKRSLDFR